MRSSPTKLATLAAVFALFGCTASPLAVPSPSPASVPTPPLVTVSPTATPAASVEVSPSVDVTPSAEPSPVSWSEPELVGGSAEICFTLAVVIDGTGGGHVAYGCHEKMGYGVEDGTEWKTTEFAPPAKRLDLEPHLAVEGDVLYMAYTRVAIEEGGCGDDGLRDVGMHVRTRKLPAGGWSDSKLIGEVEDHVHSFRVVDGTIHATVENAKDGRVYYVTSRGASYHRYLIPNATGASALRVGDDGRARVAYEADAAIWYGTFTGSGFASEKIEGSTNGYRPVLVLGAGDRPYLLWRRGYHEEGGCIGPGPEPIDGTYFGTKADGAWKVERLTPEQSAASLTLDVDTGLVHAVIGSPGGWLVYLSGPGGGSWARHTFENVRTGLAVIRLDPTTGAVLVAYVGRVGDREHVYAMRFE